MSIQWDETAEKECQVESADDPTICPSQIPGGTGEGDTTEDPEAPDCQDLAICCADPVYADGHPTECAAKMTLKLKPEFSVIPVLGSVQYKTYLVNYNGEES
jgi:hypothetical protein